MVTDIIDREEPLRNKLRTLGVGIISDIFSVSPDACTKISEAVSFLDIASAMNIISEMNCNILKKEFVELNKAIQNSFDEKPASNQSVDLSAFFREELSSGGYLSEKDNNSIGHHNPTRIGVQKGSTLMKALSDRTGNLHNNSDAAKRANFDELKKERRYNIIKIIKNNGGSATIKDIREKMNTKIGESMSFSEKTLQRELLSMIKDDVLYKTGEKRWSKYFIKMNPRGRAGG